MEIYKNRIERAYYKDFGRYPILTRQQEKDLLTEYHNGNDYALDMLVNCNLRFVLFILKKHYSKWLWAFADSKQDLINEGNIGLMRAAKKFDISKVNDVTFNSYAVWWVKQAFNEFIMENFHLVRVTANKFADMLKLRKKLDQMMTLEEIADEKKVPVNELDDLNIDVFPIKEDVVTDRWFNNIDSQIDAQIKVSHILETLKQREKDVIRLYYGIGDLDGRHMTLEEIGKKMGVSKEMIRILKNRAIKKLRQVIHTEKKQEFYKNLK